MIGSTNCKKVIEQINYIEYIESNGTQYIDTEFTPNQDTRVVMDYQPVDTINTIVFGSRTSTGSSDRFLVLHAEDTNSLRTDYYNANIATGLNPTDRTIIDKNKNITTINGQIFTANTATFQSNLPIYFFAGNTGGSMAQPTIIRLYSLQLYNNGTLIRDYWPALDKSGVACLYDKVNKQYVYNSGTGNFITP